MPPSHTKPLSPLGASLRIVLAFLLVATAALAEVRATGTLTLNDAAYPISNVTALRLPSTFADGALVTRVVLADLPVPAAALRENIGLMTLRQKGGLHAVMLEFSDTRSYTTLNLVSSDHNTSVSMSGTMDVLQLTTHSPTRIEGALKREASTMGDLTFSMDITFAADVEAYEAPKMGAVKKGAEAQALESVKAYLAMRKAVRAADLVTIRKLARYPQDFESADGLKFVKMMQSEEPANIEVVEAAEGADVATLTVTGTLEGKPVRRTFDMQKKEGRWTTNNDNWQAN
jgi:hypothetical protein